MLHNYYNYDTTIKKYPAIWHPMKHLKLRVCTYSLIATLMRRNAVKWFTECMAAQGF